MAWNMLEHEFYVTTFMRRFFCTAVVVDDGASAQKCIGSFLFFWEVCLFFGLMSVPNMCAFKLEIYELHFCCLHTY